MVLEQIKEFIKKFSEQTQGKTIHLVSHFDTDGITSATIFAKTLERLNKRFSIKILKQLDVEDISEMPEDKILVLLDLGSGSLNHLSNLKNQIFIIDHHEISKTLETIPKNVTIINPHLLKNYEELCTAELTYLVSKEISESNKELAYLSVIGMIGDVMEKNISKIRNMIIEDSKVTIKKGLLLYPSTRPLDKTIEYSSSPFIPGATGNHLGSIDLLNEAGIKRLTNNYKPLIDLNEKEMKNLTTAVLLRLSSKQKASDYIGNLYLVRFFNKIEDAREISAVINACSRMDYPQVAFMMCMGNFSARKKAEGIYVKYRQHIISGLKYIDKNIKIQGREYVIINAKDNVKDTIIGTLASILSFSAIYEEGTIIVAMAYNKDKIKVSTRISGKSQTSSRNLKELLDSITQSLGGESGGHKNAAGCIIHKEQEDKFIDLIKKKLEFELVKI
ncbi:MAG: DHH family phosphoesterase [Nanoarchaeota archaeon]